MAARRPVVLLIVCVAAVGCGVRERPGDGPGGRHQPRALTPKQELAVGRQAAAEIKQEYAGRFLPADSAPVRQVRRVLGRLARAAEIEPLQDEINLTVRGYRFEWEGHVIREDTVNAFCLPAGKVFVFTGILRVAATDDLLATVLSHEIAHALAHHASERIAREQSARGILSGLRYGRMQETEADRIGVFLMAFAGYDPDQAPVLWQRMHEGTTGGGRLPEILSTHPHPESRVRDLRRYAPRAKAAKRAFDEGRIAPPRRVTRGGER